eukprot:676810-Prymnesium_polylepis.1
MHATFAAVLLITNLKPSVTVTPGPLLRAAWPAAPPPRTSFVALCSTDEDKPHWRKRLRSAVFVGATATALALGGRSVRAGDSPVQQPPEPPAVARRADQAAPRESAALATMAARTKAVPRPWRSGSRRKGGRIADEAEMISSSAKPHIMRTIRKAEEETGAEVMVVTLRSIGGRPPKAFATILFNEWGVGTASNQNGVLVLVVKDARRIEVEVGLSLNSKFSRRWTEEMLSRHVLPRFKEGRYSEGL